MTTIAHVDAETGFSGGEVQVFLLMEGLRARGHGNVLVCPPDSAAARACRERDFPLVEVPMRNDLDLPSAVQLARRLAGTGADLAHLHTGRATWLGGMASLAARMPSIATRRMDRRVRPGARTNFLYRRCVERTVAISPAVERCLLEGGVPAERVEVVWDAVDPEQLSTPTVDLRASDGPPRATALLLSLAALVHRKGIDVALDALALLVAEGRDVELWVGGEGDEREALETHAATHGLDERVRWLGWRDDKADLLAAADVFVLPSRREGVGVAALEAMASGTPVVATDVGGLSEAVVDGEAGLLVAPDDPAALAEAIGRVLDRADRGAALGAAGAARVRERFSADTMVERYLEVYDRVLAESPRRRAR